MMMMVMVMVMVIRIVMNIFIMKLMTTHCRSTGEDDLDLRSSCKSGFEDEGCEENLEEVENKGEEVTEQEKKKEENEEKEEEENEEEERKEEDVEEDLEYLRLNCTRMSTRRATNFSQVCHCTCTYVL